jgi:hypothetical protein
MGIISTIRRVVRNSDQLAHNSERTIHLLEAIVQGIANQADLQNRRLQELSEQIASSNQAGVEASNRIVRLMEASIVLQRDRSDALDELTQAVDELRGAILGGRPISRGETPADS